jgi:hypothetical protein
MMLLNQAIKRLRPNTDFVIYGDTLDGLEFVNPITTIKPTQAEVNKAISEIESEQATELEKTALNKASGLAKLAALGLTEDEAKAVFGV